jgi:hypothetical protein
MPMDIVLGDQAGLYAAIKAKENGIDGLKASGQKMKCKLITGLYYALALFVLVCIPGQAQTTAAVTGAINDPSGAVIQGATVTLMNLNTGVQASATTNSAGLYRAPGLLPGTYRITVSKSGFKSSIKNGVELHGEDTLALNFALQIGSASETVTVQAGASIIETDSPTVSQVIEEQQIDQTPLNGRNVMNLVALTPGVVPQGGTSGAPTQNQLGGALTSSFGWNNYQIGGGQAGQGSEYLDEAPLNVLDGHSNTLVPTQDAIGEFRVQSSVVDLQYGDFGGGVVSFATKSGTKDFHGSMYEYIRNTDFDANNFFNNLTGLSRSKLIQNQYGAFVGGPLARGNKAFFFSSWEGFRLKMGIPDSMPVPSSAELSGDFTADAPIYEPFSNTQISCNNVLNTICSDRFDKTSNYMANTLGYWPLPNKQINGFNYYVHDASSSSKNNQFNERVDWSLGSKQKLFGRYTRWNVDQDPTQYVFGISGPTSTPGFQERFNQIALGDNVTVSSRTAISARLSYLRNYYSTLPADMNVDLAAFGPFYAAIANQVDYKEFPGVFITSGAPIPYLIEDQTSFGRFNNYVGSASILHAFSRHTLSAGGEFRRMEDYYSIAKSPDGFAFFTGAFTHSAIADFLLGLQTMNQGFMTITTPSAVSNYGGLYIADTFQYNSRLTMNYGVRWEMPGGFTVKNDSNTVLLPQLANPLVLVHSQQYHSRSDIDAHRTLFSPRVGLVFRADAKTTLRAGYSLTYIPQDVVEAAEPITSPVNGATTYSSFGASESEPLFGSTTLSQPVGRGYDGTQYLGQSVGSRIPNESYPYQYQWNFNAERTIGVNAVLQVGYVGSRGLHMPLCNSESLNTFLDINQLPDKYLGTPASQLSQSLRPYPQYQNVGASSPFVGDVVYNSLQATFTEHFKSGGTVMANYTFSHMTGNADGSNGFLESNPNAVGYIQDNNNLRGEISRMAFDVPQRLVVNYVLALPFGTGKRFLSGGNAISNAVAGGWSLSGITSFSSGFPLSLYDQNGNTLTNVYGAGMLRPNYTAGCNKTLPGSLVQKAQGALPVFNSSCFTAPADTEFGNEPRVDPSLRSQGTDNWDLSLSKNMTLHERLNLEFKIESFNIANRVQFVEPDVNLTDPTFGVISSQQNEPRLLQFMLRLNF